MTMKKQVKNKIRILYTEVAEGREYLLDFFLHFLSLLVFFSTFSGQQNGKLSKSMFKWHQMLSI